MTMATNQFSLRRLGPRAYGLIAIGFALLALTPLVRGQAQESVSGKWLGDMEVTSELGEVKHYTEVLVLNQHGVVIDGSVGLSDANQTPISHGKIAGRKVKFTVMLRPGVPMGFHLDLDGDSLRGFARARTSLGKVYASMTLQRKPHTI
jgi:hypothetical protein